ncbi:MAG TPA: TetR/AcrR family transcriptional regulator [Bryobacteraceae bacterium]|nr:TetR/AcrR family transcriptional regulator [Bryobacteraceae bacterium]
MLGKEDLYEISQRGRGRPRDELARQRILDSALALVEQVGFASATTDAIADRAGASKSTIYRWWPNKAAVVIEALQDQVSQEQPFPNTGNLRQDIHQQLQNFIAFLTGRRGRLFMAFIAAAQSDPEVAEAFRELWIKPRRREARHVLERYQREGLLSGNADLGTALDLIYGPIYFRLLAGHAPLNPEFGRMIADLALNGLMTFK